jgi:short-subunit dehydrogenase
MSNQNKYTLVTGASHGIGKALCIEFARLGHNLFMVALPNADLQTTVDEIRSDYDIEVKFFGIDLTKMNAPSLIYNYAREQKIKINVLVNNAGIGSGGLFKNSNAELNSHIMMLNNHAMVGITKYFIEDLIELSPSYIMNISSMEATLPLPYKAVYTGTKNFIYSFSLALGEELKPDNVKVSIVCPGSVATNEDGWKRIKAMGWKAKLILKTPQDVAKTSIQKMYKGKRVIIPGFFPTFIIRIMHFIPVSLKMIILEKIFRKYKDHQHNKIENKPVSDLA